MKKVLDFYRVRVYHYGMPSLHKIILNKARRQVQFFLSGLANQIYPILQRFNFARLGFFIL